MSKGSDRAELGLRRNQQPQQPHQLIAETIARYKLTCSITGGRDPLSLSRDVLVWDKLPSAHASPSPLSMPSSKTSCGRCPRSLRTVCSAGRPSEQGATFVRCSPSSEYRTRHPHQHHCRCTLHELFTTVVSVRGVRGHARASTQQIRARPAPAKRCSRYLFAVSEDRHTVEDDDGSDHIVFPQHPLLPANKRDTSHLTDPSCLR